MIGYSLKNIYGILVIFSFISCQLYAGEADKYVNALRAYQNSAYQKAYPTLILEAKNGNKEAQYLVAHMLEDGLGIPKDTNKSSYWYKQASSKYAYLIKDKKRHKLKSNNQFFNRVKNQLKYSSTQKGINFAFAKVNTTNKSVKSSMMKILENTFGMQPYHTNFIAPFSYANTSYKRHFSTYPDNHIPLEWQEGLEYNNHLEIETQLSFQKPLTYNLFGWNEYIKLAYTQKIWWKLYDASAPFRETNYIPEFFMLLPTSDFIDKAYYLKGVKFGYRHQSNGQEGYKSRSWDRLFVESIWQWSNFFINLQAWYRIPEEAKGEAFYSGLNPNDNESV